MQLDRTHVVIRARMLSEIGDLAMILIRNYPAASMMGFLVGALPWMVLNLALIGWIPIFQFELAIYDDEMQGELFRYLLLMTTLVVLQAPIAGVLTTSLIGRAVFETDVTWRSAIRDLRKITWRLLWMLGVVRGPIPLMIVIASNWGQEVAPWREIVLPIVFLLVAMYQRGRRPFVPEILVLERCPLRAKLAGAITANRRAAALHGPMTSDLVGRFLTVSLMLAVLSLAAFQTMLSIRGVLLGQWDWGPVVYLVFIPLALWFAAGLSTLVRFLSYLDTRIRLEGWEVDLAIRAETQRQFGDQQRSEPQVPPAAAGNSNRIASGGGVAMLAAAVLSLAWGGAGNLRAAPTPLVTAGESEQAAGSAGVKLERPPSTPWYDPKSDALLPIEVRSVQPDSANRDSRWLPKPKRLPVPNQTSSGWGSGGGWGALSTVFSWLTLIVIVVVLVWMVLFVFNRMEPDAVNARKSSANDAMVGVDQQMLERMQELPAEVRHADGNLRAEAERLMSLARFDEAIVMLFGHQLLLLDRCRVLRLARGKTNGRYVRETRVNSPDATIVFSQTVAAFEASYFGGHTPTPERFAMLWRENANLESVVRPLWEAAG